MTYTWEVLQLHFISQEMLHSHKMLHTGELRLLVFNPLPCLASVSKDGLGSLISPELRAGSFWSKPVVNSNIYLATAAKAVC